MNSQTKKEKKPVNKFIEKSGFSLSIWSLFLILAAIKLFLAGGQHLSAVGGGMYDDRLFINLADSILKLDWLGKFDNLTLAKGPFFSIWIAFTNLIHIPLLLSEQLLYAGACLALVIGLRPLFSKTWQLASLYAVILFNPISFTNGPATRAIREGLYQPLTLLLVALFIGLALREKKGLKNIIIWSITTGLALSAFWLTREEGLWIMPFAIFISAWPILKIWKSKIQQLKLKIFLYLFPFLLLIISINLVSLINYNKYGIFNVVEFKAPEFLSAYGSLNRVKSSSWIKDVPVSNEKRALIYAVSPTFSELKPYLDGKLGRRWTKTSAKNSDPDNPSEIKGGWFMWAFRDSVAKAGYYRDGKSTLIFYKRLASEVNLACEKKELDCYPERASMMPPWNQNYNKPFLNTFLNSFSYTATFKDFDAVPSTSNGNKKSLKLFSEVTRENLFGNGNNSRISILKAIGKTYQFATPILAIISFTVFLFIFIIRKFWRNKLWLISIFLLASITARLFMLSLIHVTSFPVIGTIYLSPVYSLVLVFMFLNLLPVFLNRKSDETN